MTTKQKELAEFMFLNLYNNIVDENGQSYTDVYSYEIEELVKDMCNDLHILCDVFGEYTADDVEKIFALHYWDTLDVVNCDTLRDIAIKFDELYGDSIGDTPTLFETGR